MVMLILADSYDAYVEYMVIHDLSETDCPYIYHGDQLKHVPRHTPIIILPDTVKNYALTSHYLKEFKEVAYV